MKDEKILSEELMSEEELDNVAGGNRLETYGDGDELYKRGLLSAEDAVHSAPVREILRKMGYAGYEDKGGLFNANIYTDKSGNKISFFAKIFGKILTRRMALKLLSKIYQKKFFIRAVSRDFFVKIM